MSHAELLFDLVGDATGRLRGREVVLGSLSAEESDFVRFNRARVRQAMTVRQAYLTLHLIDGMRRDTTILALGGGLDENLGRVRGALESMRTELVSLPEDPYLLYSTEPSSSERTEASRLPSGEEALELVLDAARGTDFVGLLASGPVERAFASSLGHRHTHQVSSYQLDFSLYHAKDKAAKGALSAFEWDPEGVRARIGATREELSHLALPPKKIGTGPARAYLAPEAVAEIMTMLSWGGVSEKAQRTKTSCLQRLVDGENRFSEKLTLRENVAGGLSPGFDDVGFEKPAFVSLIEKGRHAGALVSARTGVEYGITANGAGAEEALTSTDVAPGELDERDALARLGTGVYVKNLWYLGFSDRPSGRITGMTRFATSWVEDGRIVGPLDVMRFDDSLYRMLGQNLVDLTSHREFILSTSTYWQRSVETARVPGALLSELLFTL